jgi:hypothetical protein
MASGDPGESSSFLLIAHCGIPKVVTFRYFGL